MRQTWITSLWDSQGFLPLVEISLFTFRAESAKRKPGTRSSLLFLSLDNGDLDLGFDVEAEVQADFPQAEFPDRAAFHLDHLRLDHQALRPQATGDLGSADGTVQMALVVGVRLALDGLHALDLL